MQHRNILTNDQIFTRTKIKFENLRSIGKFIDLLGIIDEFNESIKHSVDHGIQNL